MPISQLEKPQWQPFFDRVSAALSTKSADIDIAGPAFGSQTQARHAALIGISYDSKDDVFAIIGEDLEHNIARPRQVTIDRDLDTVRSLEVVDAAGDHHIVTLTDPLRLPDRRKEIPMRTPTGMESAEARLHEYEQAEQLANEHLAKFDDLDYNVFSNQDWVRLHESHAEDVLVHWPDGQAARGLKRHIDDLSAMFVYAPDTRIKVHPVRIAHGEWTSVIGIMEGTFTTPMPTPDGKTIPPTGKSFKLSMCTVGHWKNGVMDEEYLFWDNQAYMKQLGIA